MTRSGHVAVARTATATTPTSTTRAAPGWPAHPDETGDIEPFGGAAAFVRQADIGGRTSQAGPVGSVTVTRPSAIVAMGIHKAFGGVVAVERPPSSRAGQLVALLGPSGSGEDDHAAGVAGLEAPDRGKVSIGGRAVVGPAVWVEPEERQVGMVFQDGALFPHLTVAANVASASPKRSGRGLPRAGGAGRTGPLRIPTSSRGASGNGWRRPGAGP